MVEGTGLPAWRSLGLACIALAALLAPRAAGQTRPAAPQNNRPENSRHVERLPAVPPELIGRTVESVRIMGNTQVPTSQILNLVRTHEGDKFDPQIVEEDYQRIFRLRRFSDVEAKVEPTATGVSVIFIVHEQRLITLLGIRGNVTIPTATILRDVIDIKEGEAIDNFRISLARRSIEQMYREKNYPYAHVTVDSDALRRHGELNFDIVEGPEVLVRRVSFKGNNSFTDDRLRGQIRTAYWIPIFRAGTFDAEVLEDDVAAVRKYYQDHGFFDAKVGRKVIHSPDLKEIQVEFVIDEGVRYKIDKVIFRGNTGVSEAELRSKLKLVEGQPYNNEVLQRDLREVVRAYSPSGFIYQPQSDNPDYLRIVPKPVFKKEPGSIELVYTISEGKPFQLGRIIVRGNYKTQEKVVLREMRVADGQQYNSAEIADAQDRLRSLGYFKSVTMTPIGEEPEKRDLLVEIVEGPTASFNVGAGVNSNGGLGGNLTYEQRNYDFENTPNSWRDLFSDRAYTGAGQTFRISFEPGTEQSNASIRFVEPFIFDQKYSLSLDGYLKTRFREAYEDTRVGGRIGFGKRFNYLWSASIYFRGEDVEISDIDTPRSVRAPEILAGEGHTTLTSVGAILERNTLPPGFLPWRGSDARLEFESLGALGGEVSFQRIKFTFDAYHTIGEDLLDRKTILGFHFDSGYDIGDSPFFERFYGGGLGSVRGFSYRGISPRSGPDEDPIGGDFFMTGTLEVSFPLVGDSLRGVVFADAGDVEPTYKMGTIRTSVGAGIRLTLPIFGQAPLALDFGFPLNDRPEDDKQIVSFAFGLFR